MLVLASASPRRRELLAQAGFSFQVHPAHIPEDPHPNEDPISYVTRLAREKAQAVFRQLTHAAESSIAGDPGLASALYQGTTSKIAATPGLDDALYQGTTSKIAVMPGSDDVLYQGTTGEPTQWVGRVPQLTQNEVWALAPEGILSDTLAVLGADTTVTLDNQILGKPEDPADAARILRLLSGRTHHVITGIALVTAERTQAASEVTAVKFLTLSDREIAAYIATGEPMDKAGAYAIQGRAARWIPRIEGDYFNVVGLPIALVSTMLKSLSPSHLR